MNASLLAGFSFFGSLRGWNFSRPKLVDPSEQHQNGSRLPAEWQLKVTFAALARRRRRNKPSNGSAADGDGNL